MVDVVGRAVVEIDTDIDRSDVQNAGDDLERILSTSADTAVAQINQSFSQLNIDAELTNAGNVFAEGLDAAAGSAREFGGGFGDLVTAFDTFGISATGAGAAAVAAFEKIEAGSQLFGGLSDIIVSSTAAFRALSQSTRVVTAAQAALNFVLSANPIGIVVLAIGALVAAFVVAYRNSETFRRIVDAAFTRIREVVTTVVQTVGRVVRAVFGGLVGLIRGYVNAYLSVVRFAFGAIRSIIEGVARFVTQTVPDAFRRARDGATQFLSDLLATVRGLPGRILSALGNLGRILFDAGGRIIQGLIDGIRNAAGAVADAIGDVVGNIRDFLPFSPAKVGPLSGSGDPERSGERIVEMLATGIERAARRVDGPTGAAVAAVAPTGSAAAVAPSAGATTVVQQFYGPQTGAQRRREIEWALRFGAVTNTADGAVSLERRPFTLAADGG